MAEFWHPTRTPRYLFLGSMMNRNGDRPYNAGQFRSLLTQLAARSGIRDGDGHVIAACSPSWRRAQGSATATAT